MKKNNFNQNSIGTLPVVDHVVTTLADASGKNIYESYIYKTGFFRFNWHPSIEILIVLKGQVKVYTESGIFNLCTNDVTVINNNVGHATMNEEPGTIAAAIHISYEFLSELCGFHSVLLRVKRPDQGLCRFSFHTFLLCQYLSGTVHGSGPEGIRASCTVPDLSSDQHFAPSFL